MASRKSYYFVPDYDIEGKSPTATCYPSWLFNKVNLCTDVFRGSTGPTLTKENPEYDKIITEHRIQLDIPTHDLELLKNNKVDLIIDHTVEGFHYINWQLIFDVFQIIPSQLTWLTSSSSITDAGYGHSVIYNNTWELNLLNSLTIDITDNYKKYKNQLEHIQQKTSRTYDATLYACRPRKSRSALIIMLHYKELIDRTVWSWGGEFFGNTFNHKDEMQSIFKTNIYDNSSDWLTAQGIVMPDKNESFETIISEHINWNQVYDTRYQIIQETMIEEFNITPSLFLSEKSYKPFASGQPALWWAETGTVEFLRKAGYDVYDRWFNHSYDNIEDPKARIIVLVEEIERLSKLSKSEWDNILIEMIPTVELNYKTFTDATPTKQWTETNLYM
jgi:hypothetical protein